MVFFLYIGLLSNIISQPALSDNTTKKLFPPPKKNDGPSKGCSQHQKQVMGHQKAVKKVMAVRFAIKRPDLP